MAGCEHQFLEPVSFIPRLFECDPRWASVHRGHDIPNLRKNGPIPLSVRSGPRPMTATETLSIPEPAPAYTGHSTPGFSRETSSSNSHHPASYLLTKP